MATSAPLRCHLAALVLAVLLAAAAGAAAGGEVVQLDDKTFEHHTQAASGQTAGVWFVKFYAPWCGHCKSMEPDWRALSATLEGRVIVARLDCTANPATADRFGELVRGFPTLLLFRDRRVFKFSGARTVEAMAAFATETYAAADAANVPPESTGLERYFAGQARALALFVIRTYDAGEASMKTLRDDVAVVGAGWKAGGFEGARVRAVGAAGAAPALYGTLVVTLALASIAGVMSVAFITAPMANALRNEKKDN